MFQLSKVVKGRTADIFAEDDDETPTPPPSRKLKKIETKTEIKVSKARAFLRAMDLYYFYLDQYFWKKRKSSCGSVQIRRDLKRQNDKIFFF